MACSKGKKIKSPLKSNLCVHFLVESDGGGEKKKDSNISLKVILYICWDKF